MLPKIIVFASGTATGGGSGFENLVRESRDRYGSLMAEIVAVVSNHATGGVYQRARQLRVPFVHFLPSGDENTQAQQYREIVAASGAQWCALSGWLKYARGLDPRTTFNIHPALLSIKGDDGFPRFGGERRYGHYVHEAVKKAVDRGEIRYSGFSMHFVSDGGPYDGGPVFYQRPVAINASMSVDDIAREVNALEQTYQPQLTNEVVHGRISWDGVDPASLVIEHRSH